MFLLTGRVISMCGATLFNPAAAFIGFYATRPEYHGLGIGIKCWRKVLDYIGSDRNIGLCAAPPQVKMYRDKAGFVHPDPFNMLCCDGRPQIENLVVRSLEGVAVELAEAHFDEIAKYDGRVVNLNRERLLKLSFAEPDTLTLAAIDTASQSIVGYASLKPSNVGKSMLGPLYANSPQIAELLVYGLLTQFAGDASEVAWMCLDGNQSAVELASRLGLHVHGPAPRLFTKEVPPPADIDKVFGIFSPDFAAY